LYRFFSNESPGLKKTFLSFTCNIFRARTQTAYTCRREEETRRRRRRHDDDGREGRRRSVLGMFLVASTAFGCIQNIIQNIIIIVVVVGLLTALFVRSLRGD